MVIRIGTLTTDEKIQALGSDGSRRLRVRAESVAGELDPDRSGRALRQL